MRSAIRFWVRYPWRRAWHERSAHLPVPLIKFSSRRSGWARIGLEAGRFGFGAALDMRPADG